MTILITVAFLAIVAFGTLPITLPAFDLFGR